MKKLISFVLVIFILFSCSSVLGEAKKCESLIFPNLEFNASEYMCSSDTRALAAAILIVEAAGSENIETIELCRYFLERPSYIGRAGNSIMLMGTNNEDSLIFMMYTVGDNEIYYDYIYGKYDSKELKEISEGYERGDFYLISVNELIDAIRLLGVAFES